MKPARKPAPLFSKPKSGKLSPVANPPRRKELTREQARSINALDKSKPYPVSSF